MRKWLIDEPLSSYAKNDLPGGHTSPINALFWGVEGSDRVRVIPDGYNAGSILVALQRLSHPSQFIDPLLYRGLRKCVPPSMDPKEFISACSSWELEEDIGFSVLGTAIRLGMHTLTAEGFWAAELLTEVQEKRLGLSNWFRKQGCRDGFPQVCNQGVEATNAYYPFANNVPSEGFSQEFLEEIGGAEGALSKRDPIFIRGGSQSPCDYIYCYPASCGGWVALVVDAKHTAGLAEGGKVGTADQRGLWVALSRFVQAWDQIEGVGKLENLRAAFLTNRSRPSDQCMQGGERGEEVKQKGKGGLGEGKESEGPAEQVNVVQQDECRVKTRFSGLRLEYLTEHSFEFSPFSDIIFARRLAQVARKKKARELDSQF
uniref:Uncharacterized protein n=1 Tax=Chromera velia CCMP2878 TaxID=1169474 RepID=A0A0G4I5X3_9ALVE|eukprot:Cvel_67.t1-p1 / transcript=Cvel_67.t1 / gene=Cvel_67 / organism=Chromera_velia_CCMP2878 / gene_product=hypothetical protein / transcript_product=hypothetical protein / location=Cvel_scaffold6:114485-115600(+) / protein_length=372 / sequence_SO=supercontig / SO=protein_coding / is_pseudo=false